jgi:hypothetical protein
VKDAGQGKAIDVKGTPRGIVVRIRDAVLFDRAQAEIKPGGKAALKAVEEVFVAFKGNMTIEGHTDDVPINTPEFKSNWELSAARAIAVLRHFTDDAKLRQDRMQIAGYADTRPLLPNTSEAARRKNRRVEFLFQYPTLRSEMSGQVKRGSMFDFKSKHVRRKIKNIRERVEPRSAVANKDGKTDTGEAPRDADTGKRDAKRPVRRK